MPKELMSAEEYCNKVRSGEIQPKSIIDEDGNLLPHIREEVERSFAASQQAMQPMIDRLTESRRFTAEDMAFTVNTRDER